MQTAAEPRLELLGLPSLTPDQRTALKDSIRAEGILSPIVQDQFGGDRRVRTASPSPVSYAYGPIPAALFTAPTNAPDAIFACN